MGPHAGQGLKALGAVALKAAALVHHHHVKGPGIPVVIHQPANIFPVDDIQIRRRVQGPDPLGLAPQDWGYPKDTGVVPFILFLRPSTLRHFLGGDDQDLPDLEAVIFQLPDGR